MTTDWSQWNAEPVPVSGVVLLGWAYALACGPLRPAWAPGTPWPRRASIRFFSGLLLLYLAFGSPLARVARVSLFSAHVALELVILFPASALVLSGLPPALVDRVLGLRGVRSVACVLLRPLASAAVFVLIVSAWYLPRLFEWGLASDSAHALEEASLLLGALLFWWPLLGPSRLFPPLRHGGRMVYLFLVEVALTAAFSYILMAEHPMYPTYELAPRVIAQLGPADDQVLGGILLSAVSSLVLVGALGVTFLQLHRKSEEPAMGGARRTRGRP